MGDINLVPVEGGVGVEIQDIDLSKDLSDSNIFYNQASFYRPWINFF